MAYVAFNRNKTRVTRLEPNKNYAALSKYISAFLLNIPSKSIIDDLKTRNFGANRIEHGFKQLCDSAERLRNLTANEMYKPTCTAGQQPQHHNHPKGKGKKSTTTTTTTTTTTAASTSTESSSTSTNLYPTPAPIMSTSTATTTTSNKTPGRRKCEKGQGNKCELRPQTLKQPKRIVCKHIKVKEERKKCLQERRRQMRKNHKKEKKRHGKNITSRSAQKNSPQPQLTTPSTTHLLSTTPIATSATTTKLRFLSQILNATSESDSDVIYSNNDNDEDNDGGSDETTSHNNHDHDNLDNDDSLLRNVNFTSDGDYSYDDDYVS